MTTRRRFLAGLTALCTLSARGQPQPVATKPVRVGILSIGSSTRPPTTVTVFVDTLRELGWVEGRNVVYDRAYTEGDMAARLAELAGQLVARGPGLVYASNNQEALALLGRTRTIPIVFGAVAGPVEAGLVKALARRGGNATGVANIGWELGGKRMQLLKQFLPGLRKVGVLVMLNTPSVTHEPPLIEQAAGRDVEVIRVNLTAPAELDAALGSIAGERAEAVLTTHTPLLLRERKRILAFAASRKIPVVGHRSEIADDGGLFSYSSILREQIRTAARIADRVLKGTKPADIPVERPTKFELVINLKTAKVLGISIPEKLLLQADRVIE